MQNLPLNGMTNKYQLIRSGEATIAIADLTSISLYSAYVAIRDWCTPVQSRGNLALYRASIVVEVACRLNRGEWPSRSALRKKK